MIRLEIGLEIRHLGVMRVCAIEDKKLPLLLLHRIAVFHDIRSFQGPDGVLYNHSILENISVAQIP